MCVLLTIAFVREIRLTVYSPPSVLVWVVVFDCRHISNVFGHHKTILCSRRISYVRILIYETDVRNTCRQNGGVSYSDGARLTAEWFPARAYVRRPLGQFIRGL